MNAAELGRARDELASRYGPWNTHNIYLGEGVYTIGPPSLGGVEGRLRRIVQLCADLAGPLDALRIADLAAGEGNLAIEFAARGAQGVAVEGREANLEKIRFVKDVLSLDSLEVVEDDVRYFTTDRYGAFDVVIAVGIVYHLDVPEVFDFLANIRQATTRFAVIDGEVAGETRASDSVSHAGVKYHGLRWREPAGGDPLSREVLWASMGNAYSFMFTRDSFMNALRAAGFTAALECHIPALPEAATRVTALATCGTKQEYVTAPTLHEAPVGFAQELHLMAGWRRPSYARRVWARLPKPVRLAIKRLLGRGGPQ